MLIVVDERVTAHEENPSKVQWLGRVFLKGTD